MSSSCQSPFCLNVPYIPGLASSSTPKPNVQRDPTMSKEQLGGSTWVSLWLLPCKGPRPGEQKRGGCDAHGLWILQCAVNKINPQNRLIWLEMLALVRGCICWVLITAKVIKCRSPTGSYVGWTNFSSIIILPRKYLLVFLRNTEDRRN